MKWLLTHREIASGVVRLDLAPSPGPGTSVLKRTAGCAVERRLHTMRPMLRFRLALLAALSLTSATSCSEADGADVTTRLRPAPVTPSPSAPKAVEDPGPHPADIREDPDTIAEAHNKAGKKPDDD